MQLMLRLSFCSSALVLATCVPLAARATTDALRPSWERHFVHLFHLILKVKVVLLLILLLANLVVAWALLQNGAGCSARGTL